jgi:hypothetical protein
MTKTRKTRKNKKPSLDKIKKVYSSEDYNSNDGMLTTVWGPGMWHYLHTMSFNYPVKPSCEDKKHYYEFVLSLRHVLPCGKCRKNLVKNFKKLPLKMRHMESRETFSKYIYRLHELVNKMLGKNSGLTYQMVRERYEHFRSRCTKSYKEFDKELNKTVKNGEQTKVTDEKGCTEPLYGEKSKCVLQIVPQNTKCDTFQMDSKCVKKHLHDMLDK